MGGVIVADHVHAQFMHGPPEAIELFHGYTYSAHPLACAAGLATLDLYRDEDLFARARRLEPIFAQAAMSLRGLPNVVDIRPVGLAVGIDLAPLPGKPGARAYAAMQHAFNTENTLVRVTGDTLALSPPLIVSEAEIAALFEHVGKAIQAVA
jgi:beta-alanine--pyruvate transaminase